MSDNKQEKPEPQTPKPQVTQKLDAIDKIAEAFDLKKFKSKLRFELKVLGILTDEDLLNATNQTVKQALTASLEWEAQALRDLVKKEVK